MSIITDITADNELAMAVAAAIETAIGGELILGVGRPRTDAPSADLMPAPPMRVLRSAFTAGASGGAYLAFGESLAARLQAAAPDGELATALAGTFTAITTALQAGGEMQLAAAHEVTADELLAEGAFADREYAVYSLLDGETRVGAFVVTAGAAAPAGAAPMATIDTDGVETPLDSTASPAAGAPAPAAAASPVSPAAAASSPTAPAPPNVSMHQFQQLNDAGSSHADPRALSLLHDVEMGVTAELGRRRMAVRDLLALTPGAVIELDRAAGSPIDVLVNGTLIARGEVVVIDEEFGIRISEIVGGESTSAATAA